MTSTSHISFRSILALLAIAVLFTSCDRGSQPRFKRGKHSTKVLLQPYENFSTKDLETIKNKIQENYKFQVIIAASASLPQQSFIHIKSPRYRADSLISILKRSMPDSVQYIMGLTARDISMTKKDANEKVLEPKSRYQDWGIFGLGYVPGPSCVVSSFRLGGGRRAKQRLLKVCLHELGHNLGLPHCDRSDDCVMRDAAESIKSVDLVQDKLCAECKSDRPIR